MSDGQPQGGFHPGLGGPPQGRPGPWGPPQDQPSPWGPPAGQPGQYGPPAGQPGQYGPPAGQPGQYGPPAAQPGQYGPPSGHQGPPPGQYGPPAGYPGYPGDQVVVGGPAPRRRGGRGVLAVVATATAVALTAGGVYAYTALSGSAAVLAAEVPADAVAYVEVNLDPPAAQKVAAIRFLRKLPDSGVGGEDGSLLESVVEPLIEDPEARRLFAENVRPWLGKHAAMVGDPQDGEVRPVIVAATTDAGTTRTSMDRLNTELGEKDRLGYVVSGDVVHIAETQQIAETAAKDAGGGSLAADPTFSGDVERVGDDGIVTFWSDLAAAAELDPSGDATGEGRLVGSLRFTDSTADLVVRAIGNPASTGTDVVGPRLAELPADTTAAVGLSGADGLVRSTYGQLEKAGLGRQLRRAEQESGLDLPGDLAALVGSRTVLALGGTEDDPHVGLVSTTPDPEAARRAAETLLSKIDPDTELTVRSDGAGTVLASSGAYADAITGKGELGKQPNFTAALPDLATATAAVYVDLTRVSDISGEELPKAASTLRSFGLTVSTAGDTSTLHFRLVAG